MIVMPRLSERMRGTKKGGRSALRSQTTCSFALPAVGAMGSAMRSAAVGSSIVGVGDVLWGVVVAVGSRLALLLRSAMVLSAWTRAPTFGSRFCHAQT